MNTLKTAMFSAACACAFAATADTVAWWRFCDLGADGGKASAGQTFTNSVDAAKFPAYAASFMSLDAAGTDAAYMPSTANVFGDVSRMRLFDPVSGAYVGFSMALSCPWGGDGSKRSGGAYVEPDAALIGQAEGDSGDFTVECFFKTTAAGLARTQKMEPLVGQMASSSIAMAAWSLIIYNNNDGGKLWCRYAVSDSIGGEAVASGQNVASSAVVTPDVWHHAAFVFSATDSVHIKLYLDYKLVGSGASASAPRYVVPGDGERIYIGKGRVNDDRSFDGEIADVRISNAALEPKDFLRFEAELPGDRGEGWLSLDDASAFGTNEFFAANTGLSTAFAPEVTATLENGDREHSFAADVIDPRVRDTFLGDVVRTNNAALAVTAAGAADNAYVKIDDPSASYASGDFTQEFWFRVPAQTLSAHEGLACGTFFKTLVMSTGQLKFRLKDPAGVSDADIDSGATMLVNDGLWHHVALVADRTAKTASVYLDYALLGKKTDFVLKTDGTTPWTFGSARENASPQCFSGEIDEIRLTKRALGVTEFMGFGAAPGKTLLRMRFDDDVDAFPYNLRKRNFATWNDSPMGALPWYTNDVWRAELDYRDLLTGKVPNTRAVAFAGGRAGIRETPTINRSDITIEFFVRLLGRAAPWPCLVGYGASYLGAPFQNDETSAWSVAFAGTWDYAQIVFWMNPETDSDVGTSVACALSPQYAYTDLSHKGDAVGYGTINLGGDDRWRHVAITLEEIEADGATKTRVTTYWNYRQVETKDVEGKLHLPTTGYLNFGAAGPYTKRFADFMLDELRISAGKLSVDEFIHKTPSGGCLIIR